jgi:23S rRNA (pseudouridine1915-N3)-methyltransferase
VRVTIAAIGRLKAGPERELFDRFVGRAHDAGRRLGLVFDQREYPESRAGSGDLRKAQEADQLAQAFAGGSAVIALDERGTAHDSRGFADRIARWRDGGKEQIVFVLGGADGLAPALTERADLRLAFGKLTWPHQLARVMLAEQLYRAVTILSGHPYHRD